jgi:CheY-like chemotaxis protein
LPEDLFGVAGRWACAVIWMIVICHVLVIEEEPFLAMDIQSLLALEGATSFDFADTHLDAVAAALACRPAIITSDVQLFEGAVQQL